MVEAVTFFIQAVCTFGHMHIVLRQRVFSHISSRIQKFFCTSCHHLFIFFHVAHSSNHLPISMLQTYHLGFNIKNGNGNLFLIQKIKCAHSFVAFFFHLSISLYVSFPLALEHRLCFNACSTYICETEPLRISVRVQHTLSVLHACESDIIETPYHATCCFEKDFNRFMLSDNFR